MKHKVITKTEYEVKCVAITSFYLPMLLCFRIISSAEDVMDRSLRLIEEARQALKNPESPNNAINLTQVAKDVPQVRWI